MQKSSARIISILFHPLIIPTIGILLLFNSGTYLHFLTYPEKRIIFILVILSTFVLPITFTPFYLFQKIIKNIEMESSKERIIPYLITGILYLFSFYLVQRINVPSVISRFILFSAFTIFILLLTSFKWKISAHMTAIGGLAGAILGIALKMNVNLDLYFIGTIITSGLLGYARLKLNAHKPFEIYTGWLMGFFILFFSSIF